MAHMAPASASNTVGEEKRSEDHDQEQKHALQVGWKSLFNFTTKTHLPIMCGAILSSIVAAGTLPTFSIFYGFIFRDYSDFGAGKIEGNAFLSRVTRHCLMLTGIASLNWLANSFYFFFFLTFGEFQARSARDQIFDALIQKDVVWYDTRNTGVAALLPAIQMHVRDLQLSVSAPFGESTQCMIMGIGALGVAFTFSWNLTLVVLCTIPLIYLFQTFIARWMSIRTQEQAAKLQLALKYIITAIQNIETVKYFNGERHELQTFTKVTAFAAKLYTRVACLRSIQIGVMQFFTLSVFVQGFWYGGHLVRSGENGINEVLTTFWAALLFINGITGFLPQFVVMQKGKVAGARLQALMENVSSSNQSREISGEIKPERCLGDIEFRQVTFSYPTRADEVAIRDISILFPAGETTFVIGRSGSGKSTLGQLLVRFYPPSSGEILLDGHPLNSLDTKWLRQNVTLVEQHSVLFNDTIRQNIALGSCGDAVSMQDIEEVIEFAMMDSIVQELPDGLDTPLGLKGGSLSGGQKQRLALARSKMRDTPVLILDESTSALDHVTRDSIIQSIRLWRTGKTTVIITHDVSQIRSSDFVYLLDNTELVQEGYRKELEAQPGVFQALLAAHSEEENGCEDDSSPVYSEQTDAIISLYDENAWEPHAPVHRPMSAVLFAENVLSPYSKTIRESFVGSINPISGETYATQQGGQAHTSELLSPDRISIKPPPGMLLPSYGAAQTRRHSSRPCSRASLQKAFLGFETFNQPVHLQEDCGPQPRSRPSSRPVSRKVSIPYSRPLSVFKAQSVRLSSRGRSDRRHKLLQIWDSRKTRDIQETSSSTHSLPITKILKSVWPVLSWHSRAFLCVALLCALVHAAITPIFAWVFAQLLSTFYEPDNQSRRSLILAMIILGLAIVDGAATHLLFFLADSVAQSWAHALKIEAMRNILMQPRKFFDQEENSISRLAETLDHFAEEARNLPGRFAITFISMTFMIAISMTWSLIISWRLALVALACGPVLFGITKTYNMISSHWERLANEADDVVGQILHECIVNIQTVRCLTLEGYFKAKHTKATTDAINIGVKRALWSGSIFGLNFAAVLFVAILLFWYGAVLAANRQNKISEITETFLILMLSVNHINYIGHYITQVNMSREAGSRLIHLARMPTKSHELSGTIKVQAVGDISFNKVNFAYPTRKDVQVLHDVSFTIPQGSCTAIVGSSGSGKSTIASLLLKLYKPKAPCASLDSTTANLTVSNMDINSLNTKTLRSKMAIVSQTPAVFPGTIAENIAYGLDPSSPLSSMHNIRAAADAAGINEFIASLPNGYNTLIGEGGTGLSGGQAQRLAIARALVRDPDVLILDEATSALDGASARVVRDTIRKLVGGTVGGEDAKDWESGAGGVDGGKGKERRKRMTVVIITHAREMMAVAEHVVVLERGRVVEQGSFGELKKRRVGAFARLYRGERREL